ncbi:MAG: arsenosugar biosynthesis radical SAM protein ArsS [Planctomycetota bacterium]|nr:arsenosugar biosynthesis radical SAM protein ArsS [Planctomycetota bacterium]MDA1212974.1 arsenosugar biosynthesis radical SAM protein ArsS [Planctomycetota bacterium]
MTVLTLLRQHHPLSEARRQVQILEGDQPLPRFGEQLAAHGLPVLQSDRIEILQVNVGKLCNQTCRHCHVDAGPDRREIMTRETMQACLDLLAASETPVVDITGGAPEMNPHFCWFIDEIKKLDRHVIDRCNLTILLANGYDDLAEFLAGHRVEIVASLPCYLEENTDRQRGDGVFAKSIAAIKRLNDLGYGKPESGLVLNLVFNPQGISLPPPQEKLDEDYHRELGERYGVVFNRLYTITNLPISRFLDDLLQTGRYETYMQKLVDAFNPAAVSGVMCRNTLSVDWNGNLYDCDFNQMLELGVEPSQPRTIFDADLESLSHRKIVTGRHCFGCTAGAGSSCQGVVTG